MRGVHTTMTLILTILAVARVTRLVTADYLTAGPRAWALKRLDGHDKAQYLLVCPWCLSMWVGAAAAAAWWAWGDSRIYTAVCTALAASYAAGWLASKEGD